MATEQPKTVRWVGSSQKDLRSVPKPVRVAAGHAIYAAQKGETDPAAKPLKGFGRRSVLEIVTDHRGETDAVYVLHVFQKKSNSGIATPKKEMDLIRQRLAGAERYHRERQN